VAGGETLVRGAVGLARRFRVSPMLIGLTLVGFGTSTPELVTSLQAAVAGSPGIALGNVVGSNIGNILLIIGLAALVRPLDVERAALRRDGGVLAAVSLLCLVMVLGETLGRLTGAACLALLALYLGLTILLERRRASPAGELYRAEAATLPAEPGGASSAVMLLAGLAFTLIGARLLVTGAVSIAAAFGLSETVIGLTIVAIGTSAPELVTSVMAARRGESGVAFGNIIGSNIFNVLGILGVTALVQPMAIPAEIAQIHIWVMLAATAALLAFAATAGRITAYIGYTGALLLAAAV
jgi:cation:H+ antiporter